MGVRRRSACCPVQRVLGETSRFSLPGKAQDCTGESWARTLLGRPCSPRAGRSCTFLLPLPAGRLQAAAAAALEAGVEAGETGGTLGALDLGGSSLEVTFAAGSVPREEDAGARPAACKAPAPRAATAARPALPHETTASAPAAAVNATLLGASHQLYSHVHHHYGLNDAFDTSVSILLARQAPTAGRSSSKAGGSAGGSSGAGGGATSRDEQQQQQQQTGNESQSAAERSSEQQGQQSGQQGKGQKQEGAQANDGVDSASRGRTAAEQAAVVAPVHLSAAAGSQAGRASATDGTARLQAPAVLRRRLLAAPGGLDSGSSAPFAGLKQRQAGQAGRQGRALRELPSVEHPCLHAGYRSPYRRLRMDGAELPDPEEVVLAGRWAAGRSSSRCRLIAPSPSAAASSAVWCRVPAPAGDQPSPALSAPSQHCRPDFAVCRELAAAVVNASVPCSTPPCALGTPQVGPACSLPRASVLAPARAPPHLPPRC